MILFFWFPRSMAHPSLQPQLADIGSHMLNFMHSIAEEAALTDTAMGDISAAAVSAATGEAGQAAADAAEAANGSGGGGIFEGLAVAFTEFLKVCSDRCAAALGSKSGNTWAQTFSSSSLILG